MSIESELAALRASVDTLTAAIAGYAESRLTIFHRAESIVAIPLTPDERAFAAVASPRPVLTPEDLSFAPEPEPVKTAQPAEPVKALEPEPVKAQAAPEPIKAPEPEPVKAPEPEPVKAQAEPDALDLLAANDPVPAPEPTYESVRAMAVDLIKLGRRDRVHAILTGELGVGSIDKLDGGQRARFAALASVELKAAA